jgi:hypothetical protein
MSTTTGTRQASESFCAIMIFIILPIPAAFLERRAGLRQSNGNLGTRQARTCDIPTPMPGE